MRELVLVRVITLIVVLIVTIAVVVVIVVVIHQRALNINGPILFNVRLVIRRFDRMVMVMRCCCSVHHG